MVVHVYPKNVASINCSTSSEIYLEMFAVLLLCGMIAGSKALQNGVGRLPAMGYDTFNAFGCDYNASSVLAQAQAMQRFGLVDAGYKILILDDCYALKQRNASGYMVADPTKFPDGMENFSRSINDLDIELAAYGDSGYQTCAGYP